MNAASASRFMGRLQDTARRVLPATIQIDGQAYEVGTSGVLRDFQVGPGPGGEAIRRISFFLAAADVAAAGQPVPREQTEVICLKGGGATDADPVAYNIEKIGLDPTGVTYILECANQPQ